MHRRRGAGVRHRRHTAPLICSRTKAPLSPVTFRRWPRGVGATTQHCGKGWRAGWRPIPSSCRVVSRSAVRRVEATTTGGHRTSSPWSTPRAAWPTRPCSSTSGPSQPGMVVRLPPLEPTFPDYDLGPQALVQNVVAAAGVPAPAPAVVEHDPSWVGSPFLVMPMVRGDIPGPAPVLRPLRAWRPAPMLQRRMHDGLFDTLVAIHAVPWEASDLGGVLPGLSAHDALARWSAYVEWSSRGRPAARAGHGAGVVRRPPAGRARQRSCCGATSGWATSSSTRSAG